MKMKFCIVPICLWNFLLVSASSPEVVKRSAEHLDSRFQRNVHGPIHYHRHHYPRHQSHRHPHPEVHHSIFPSSHPPFLFPPRPDDHNTRPKHDEYPWKSPYYESPWYDHRPQHSFEEPTGERDPWNGALDTWPSSAESSPGIDEDTDFEKETEDSQDKEHLPNNQSKEHLPDSQDTEHLQDSQDTEHLPDCHCTFENIGSRTMVTVSIKRTPAMTTPPTTTSTSTTTMTTTSTTPSTSSTGTTSTTPSTSFTGTTTEFDWNAYVEKELSVKLNKNNPAGIGIIDVRLKKSN